MIRRSPVEESIRLEIFRYDDESERQVHYVKSLLVGALLKCRDKSHTLVRSLG